MWMNAALLSPCVTSMPIVKTLSAPIVVPVKLDLLGTGKRALVREEKNSKVFIRRILHFKRKRFSTGADSRFFRMLCTTVLL